MMVYVPPISSSAPVIIGQIYVLDPDVEETFNITFSKENFQALSPATNEYTIISDDGSVAYVRITITFEIDDI